MKLFILLIWLSSINGPTSPINAGTFYTIESCYQTGIKWEQRIKEYGGRSGQFACLPIDFLP